MKAVALSILLLGCRAPTQSDSTFDASTDPFDAAADPFDGLVEYDVSSFPIPDAAPPATLVDGGGPFRCAQCPCDGRTHYCDTSTAGPPAPEPDYGEAGCQTASPRCKPYPAACDGSPSCACIIACDCARAASGDGLFAGCSYP
ncbi:hypothetical protein BH09MYX1_BH09MYX1_46970 [soil metagenome]